MVTRKLRNDIVQLSFSIQLRGKIQPVLEKGTGKMMFKTIRKRTRSVYKKLQRRTLNAVSSFRAAPWSGIFAAKSS